MVDLGSGRSNQKLRTRTAIVDAARALVQSQAAPTMPAVAALARVSEATAYRYFPDLAALLREALSGIWNSPGELMADVADEPDVPTRVAFAVAVLLGEVRAHEGAVRIMMSTTIARPAGESLRPGRRFGLIDIALEPITRVMERTDPARLAQLKMDLAVVISAEAYFTLTDLCGLAPDAAIASVTQTATTLARAALSALTPVPSVDIEPIPSATHMDQDHQSMP